MAWFKEQIKESNHLLLIRQMLPDWPFWFKTPNGSIIHTREMKNNSFVCPDDEFSCNNRVQRNTLNPI